MGMNVYGTVIKDALNARSIDENADMYGLDISEVPNKGTGLPNTGFSIIYGQVASQSFRVTSSDRAVPTVVVVPTCPWSTR